MNKHGNIFLLKKRLIYNYTHYCLKIHFYEKFCALYFISNESKNKHPLDINSTGYFFAPMLKKVRWKNNGVGIAHIILICNNMLLTHYTHRIYREEYW